MTDPATDAATDAETDAACGLRYGGHIDKDAPRRARKARKIEALLAPHIELAACDALDLGAGSGLLSAYFHPRVRSLIAMDREPDAFLPEGIEILPSDGDALPFEDARFDLILFNHVIEHVGDRAAQDRMLAEIRRVLRPGGVLYLAVPNRFALLEPHYRLPLLSWLPQRLADFWVRRAGRNPWYDCNPYTRGQLLAAMRRAGFAAEDLTVEAVYQLLEIEMADKPLGRALARLPRALVAAGAPLAPTFIVLGRPGG